MFATSRYKRTDQRILSLCRFRKRTWIMIIGGGAACVALIFYLFLLFSLPSAHLHPVRISTVESTPEDVIAMQVALENDNGYEPEHEVAWAIPVGGHTERSAGLKQIVETLMKGGVHVRNIYVFEDVLGRSGAQPSTLVRDVCRELGVRIIHSYVTRDDQEDWTNFGIHLARHYKFMLDSVLVGYDSSDYKDNLLIKEENRKSLRRSVDKPYEFVVIMEDDLVLAPDTAKYFHEMSRVMRIDDTLYCVSAHQDNAFMATSAEYHGTKAMDGFEFRRGNHFMAPGWMTSRKIYTEVVRPFWLDEKGQYSHKDKLHLLNGHWDRFFDSLIDTRDCIFPEVPRIVHEGADGFTVSKKGQLELYTNLRLASIDLTVSYGDLVRFTLPGYVHHELLFIKNSIQLTALEQAVLYRNEKLVYVVEALSDKDEEWNAPINKFFGLIGVGGYGGFVGYVKVRGIFNGAVFFRWLSNVVMLVGRYSPYIQLLQKLDYQQIVPIQHVGCYNDKWERDLPHLVTHYTYTSVTPIKCLTSCLHLGYQYAGLQNGAECWCGTSYGKYGPAKDAKSCDKTCGPNASLLSSLTSSRQLPSDTTSPHQTCGGPLYNSIYAHALDTTYHQTFAKPNDGTIWTLADDRETCIQACEKKSGKCDETLFPQIHRSCEILKSISGCTSCAEEEDIERGFSTPSVLNKNGVSQCFLSKGKHLRCSGSPPADVRRICVCKT